MPALRYLLSIFVLAATLAHADVTGRFVAVTGGDTIKALEFGSGPAQSRLTGIGAPERGQPFGTASRDHLASLAPSKVAQTESTKSDLYGSLLGKVWVQPAGSPSCGKPLDANHAQLLACMAWWYRYYAKT